MPKINNRDPMGRNRTNWGPARRARNLLASEVGNADLPAYASALRVSVSPSASLPCTIKCVPIDEDDDGVTVDLVITSAGDRWEPISIRRIVSINGAPSAIPAGVSILLGVG